MLFKWVIFVTFILVCRLHCSCSKLCIREKNNVFTRGRRDSHNASPVVFRSVCDRAHQANIGTRSLHGSNVCITPVSGALLVLICTEMCMRRHHCYYYVHLGFSLVAADKKTVSVRIKETVTEVNAQVSFCLCNILFCLCKIICLWCP